MEGMDILRKIFPSLIEHGKSLKNSTQGNVAYIWRIKRFQMDVKVWKNANSFFSDVFPAVVVPNIWLEHVHVLWICDKQEVQTVIIY